MPHEEKAFFPKHIRRWFRIHQRDLPWRKTRNPYRIVVSEFMLQQTQVDRVLPHYHSFLKRFPSWNALARSPLAQVLEEWSGLGYNRRAQYLSTLARRVVKDFHGTLPHDEDTLRQLPGIGKYTAQAIMVFAFGQRAAPQDTNIARVVRRYFVGERLVPARRMVQIVQRALPARGVYWWNHALMDFGALVCTARKPSCQTCPLQSQCRAAPHFLRGGTATVGKRTQEPFNQSLRQLRGLLVKELLLGPQTKNRLVGNVMKHTTQSRQRVQRALRALAEEGILRVRGDFIEIL